MGSVHHIKETSFDPSYLDPCFHSYPHKSPVTEWQSPFTYDILIESSDKPIKRGWFWDTLNALIDKFYNIFGAKRNEASGGISGIPELDAPSLPWNQESYKKSIIALELILRSVNQAEENASENTLNQDKDLLACYFEIMISQKKANEQQIKIMHEKLQFHLKDIDELQKIWSEQKKKLREEIKQTERLAWVSIGASVGFLLFFFGMGALNLAAIPLSAAMLSFFFVGKTTTALTGGSASLIQAFCIYKSGETKSLVALIAHEQGENLVRCRLLTDEEAMQAFNSRINNFKRFTDIQKVHNNLIHTIFG